MLQLVPLPGNPAVTAEEIVRMRVGEDGVEGTYDDEPFSTIAGTPKVPNTRSLQMVPGFSSEAVSSASRFFSVRSSTFEVKVTSSVRGFERTLVTVLQRKNPKEVNILYTYWES